MSSPPIEPSRLLVDAGVFSFEQVEILVAIVACSPEGATTKAVAEAIRSSGEAATARLISLSALGIVLARADDPPRWVLRDDRPEIAAALEQLAQRIAKDRQAVVNQFYSQRIDHMKAFADAFKLRKDT